MLGVFEIHPESSSLLNKQRLQTAIDGRSGLADNVNINLPFPPRYVFNDCLVLVRNVFWPFCWKSGVNAEVPLQKSPEGGLDPFIGSKTETSLLGFARDYLGMGSVSTERSDANMVQVVPFDSAIKCSAVVVKLDDGRY